MFWKYLIHILWLSGWRILFFPNQGFSKAHEEIQEKANSLRKIQCSDSPYSTHCDSQRLRCKDSPSFDSQPWWKSYDLISNYDRSSGDEDEINEKDFDCSVTVLMPTWKLRITVSLRSRKIIIIILIMIVQLINYNLKVAHTGSLRSRTRSWAAAL